ncbi:N-acetylneuraminate synthase family protein [Fusobacterium varium]|uniref:N-acetylneuraminate synthase family protein n=1 Tax=Fusobacterium varium TaxID=856 RepID=UPI0001AFEE4F|nr:N-acetylneuraminate synthase family protein [Fusobacterium varium]EES65129.1 SAF domain protein [Fusobacterium varium ATCC 27725]VEH38308.1 Spore coat polysaccharide biosynthesis protein spsE [Fusobacterium varium]
MMKIKIGKEIITQTSRPYFIADIAANHDGSLERAYKLIELAKEAGADVAKFQNFKAKTIVSKKGFETMKGQISHQSNWKKTVYEVYEDASIDTTWTELLKKKCDEVGIEYMTSPYDFESVDSVEEYVNAYKIGSGDITWIEILKYIARKNKPILLATGASTLEDVKRAMETLKNNKIILMQCNTNYTGEKENFNYINLNVLKKYRELYPEIILGLSDHTRGYATVLGAIALGANVIEKHFTDDNNRIGPDHKFAMNPQNWREMVEASMDLYNALGDGEKRIEENEKQTVIVQRRGLYLKKDIKKGKKIRREDLIALRPMKKDGIEPYRMEKILDKKVKKDLYEDNYLKWEDIE